MIFLSFSQAFTATNRELGLNTFTPHPKTSKYQESETIHKRSPKIQREKTHRIEERVRDLERLIDLREEIGGEVRQESEQRGESRLRVLGMNPSHQPQRRLHFIQQLDSVRLQAHHRNHHTAVNVGTTGAAQPPERRRESVVGLIGPSFPRGNLVYEVREIWFLG